MQVCQMEAEIPMTQKTLVQVEDKHQYREMAVQVGVLVDIDQGDSQVLNVIQQEQVEVVQHWMAVLGGRGNAVLGDQRWVQEERILRVAWAAFHNAWAVFLVEEPRR